MLHPVRRSVARRARLFAFVAAIAVSPMLAGCQGNADDAARLQQQAQDALARWADAVAAAGGQSSVVVVGELNDPPVGLAIDSASGTVGGRELTVAFIGAPLPGDQACGEDYTAQAVESDLAVVVIVTRHPRLEFGACSAAGARRTASVELAAPLGERAVLEVQQGRPVPVELTR